MPGTEPPQVGICTAWKAVCGPLMTASLVLMRGQPVRGSDGNILKWLGTCTDIDAIKRAQAALLESEDRFRLFAECTGGPGNV